MDRMFGWSDVALTGWIYLGLLFRAFGNRFGWLGAYRQAVACFTRALRHALGDARLYYWRGTLYWRELGDPRQAEADLTRAIELDRQMARAYLNRAFARWYGMPPNLEGAAEDFRAYLAHGSEPYWRRQAMDHLEKLGL